MRLSELKKLVDRQISLNQSYDDPELHIVVRRSSPAIGAPHTVRVKSMHPGFDWSRGMFLIIADEQLLAGKKALLAASTFARRVRETLYMMDEFDSGRNKNGNAIKAIKEALDEWLPNRMEKKRKKGKK